VSSFFVTRPAQMELELRLSDEKAQCKAASACWKVA
jgi:hypothetical protein